MAVPAFPTLPLLGFPTRAPTFTTDKQRSLAGKGINISFQAYPTYQYMMAIDALRGNALAELQTFIGFYNSLLGGFGLFSYADPDDGAVTAQGFGAGDGATTAFQLVRAMGGNAEPVFCPTGAPQIFDNGNPVPGGNYTISNQGVVSFNVAPAPGDALTWTGTYSWYCSFDDDKIDFAKFANAAGSTGPYYAVKKITFTTWLF
jgi:hypothetical protein